MTLYYQLDTTGGKSYSKNILIDISVIPGGHFKFRPLEKSADIFGANFFLKPNSAIKTH